MTDLKSTVIESLDGLPEIDWGLKAINAHKAWLLTKGEGVKIAVIDSGIDEDHPDLKDSIKSKINMAKKNEDVKDMLGHGSSVAGLLVGKKTGVAPNADLYIAKVLDDQGRGHLSHIMDGITFAINHEVDILSMSLGVERDLPIILRERIAEAYHKGITIVCATGNSSHYEPQYPAFMDEVIGVGGLDRSMNLASFSNYGKEMNTVAPAENILSTYKDGNYIVQSGTSMASPLVAGGIALLISHARNKGVYLKSKDIRMLIDNLGEHSHHNGNGIFDIDYLISKI